MSTTGERIREQRLRNHLTLDDVAKYLGVGRQAIYKYEQGTVTNIPLENLEKMATLFGTTPEYLAGWSTQDIIDRVDYIIDRSKNAPHTIEARILARGIDSLPAEQREQALNIMRTVFIQYKGLFDDKGENNDDA